ncbi:HAD family hydrolase [Candidatus Parcubacteria bacterium]|nr:HAD family hydrolase [Candidatus Parcubacteria bacterium]
MIKGIFFDVGGTLCKSLDNKKPSFKKILAGFTNKPVTDFNINKQSYLWTSSASKKELIIRLCRDLKIDEWKALYKKFSKYSYEVFLYEDVEPCLKKLSTKYKLGLLSNTTVWTAFNHNKLGIGNYIKISVLSCKIGVAKPDVRIFNHARKAMGINAHESLYVGDNIEYDIKPALAANWKAVLLCRDKNIKNSPVPIISDLSELENVLLKFKL